MSALGLYRFEQIPNLAGPDFIGTINIGEVAQRSGTKVFWDHGVPKRGPRRPKWTAFSFSRLSENAPGTRVG